MVRRMVAVASLVAIVGVASLGAVVVWQSAGGRAAEIVLPEAGNLIVGTSVQIDGQEAGTIKDIAPEEGKARVSVSIDSQHSPLRDGTDARIRWSSVLGQRVLEVLPGPPSAPELPDGALIVGTTSPVEVENLVAALDPPTRDKLRGLIQQVADTQQGREGDINRTLATAGPAVEQLGKVLEGVSTDGPAIRGVVTELTQLTRTLAHRGGQLDSTVVQLAETSGQVARQRDALRQAVAELPATLSRARDTLDRVPPATDATVPLLADAAPVTQKLVPAAQNLGPLIRDLAPAVRDLRGTVNSARPLLERTPSLLDSAHGVLPGAKRALVGTQPALTFLRPYAPEFAGFFANWGSYSANYDANGKYARTFPPESLSTPTVLPNGTPLPGLRQDRTPAPGALVGQEGTDATGSGPR